MGESIRVEIALAWLRRAGAKTMPSMGERTKVFLVERAHC